MSKERRMIIIDIGIYNDVEAKNCIKRLKDRYRKKVTFKSIVEEHSKTNT